MKKHKKKIYLKESAVTLIALILSIIVLLILAGITFTALIGDNGILDKAVESKEKSEIASLEEEIDLAIVETIMEKEDSRFVTIEDIVTKLIENDIIEDSSKVNRKTGDITTKNPSYVISGKLDDYLIDSKTVALNAIELIETADSKLSEMDSLLQRINELLYLTLNGVTEDKASCQLEISEIIKEIDNLSETTNFNGEILLDGTLNKEIFLETESINILIDNMNSESLGINNIDVTTGLDYTEQIYNALYKVKYNRNNLGALQDIFYSFVNYKEKLEDATTLKQTAISALTSINDRLERINEVVEQTLNETYTNDDLLFVQTKINYLVKLIDIIVKITTYDDEIILNDMTAEELGINNIDLVNNLDNAKTFINEAITKVNEKIEYFNNL